MFKLKSPEMYFFLANATSIHSGSSSVSYLDLVVVFIHPVAVIQEDLKAW